VKIRYCEDYEVGDVGSFGEYTVSRDEMVEFARRWDPQPFHVDEQAAARSIFGGLTASSTHTYAICCLVYQQIEVPSAVLGALGADSLRFPNPVRPGDTLRLRRECVEKRASRRHRDRGIVKTRATLLNQRDEPVLEMTMAYLVARRSREDAR
jgi:acyl dehydratase